jgi:hypothetical protein
LANFAWIAGTWTGTGLGGISEEMWMPAAGGAMLGSFRVLKDGAVAFYELLTLLERDNTVVTLQRRPDRVGRKGASA